MSDPIYEDNRVWISPDEDEGHVNIMSRGAVMARTKSLNVARQIRDALNAPCSIIGQYVRTRDRFEVAIEGVVLQAELCGDCYTALIRQENGRLIHAELDGATIIEPPALKREEAFEP